MKQIWTLQCFHVSSDRPALSESLVWDFCGKTSTGTTLSWLLVHIHTTTKLFYSAHFLCHDNTTCLCVFRRVAEAAETETVALTEVCSLMRLLSGRSGQQYRGHSRSAVPSPAGSPGTPVTFGFLTSRHRMYRVHTQGKIAEKKNQMQAFLLVFLAHSLALTFGLPPFVIFTLTLTNKIVVVFFLFFCFYHGALLSACETVCPDTAALNCETNAAVAGLKTQDAITLLTLQRMAIRPAGLQSGESLVALAPLNQSALGGGDSCHLTFSASREESWELLQKRWEVAEVEAVLAVLVGIFF